MNRKNILICGVLGLFLAGIVVAIVIVSNLSEEYYWLSGVSFLLPQLFNYIKSLFKKHIPYKKWRASWKRIKSEINPSIIRISFSYLYRIKIDDKYLLIKNSHGTDLFQPIGGVYKYFENAKIKLKKLGAVCDNGEIIKIDTTTKNDFRLRVQTSKLPKFIRWFQKGELRETIENLSREFKEELIDTKILPKELFDKIEYTYIGQHVSDICETKFDKNLYELFIADIAELNPTAKQYEAIKQLQNQKSLQYCFVTEKMILCNKTSSGPDQNKIDIADHSLKILEITEYQLDKRKFKKYIVNV